MTNREALIAIYVALGGDAANIPAEATNADIIYAISTVVPNNGGN